MAGTAQSNSRPMTETARFTKPPRQLISERSGEVSGRVIDIGDVVRDWKCERKRDERRLELRNRGDDGCWRDRARHLERGDDVFAIARGERALRDGTFRHGAAVLLRAAARKLSRL